MLTEEEKAGSPGYNIDGMPKQVENGLDPIKAWVTLCRWAEKITEAKAKLYDKAIAACVERGEKSFMFGSSLVTLETKKKYVYDHDPEWIRMSEMLRQYETLLEQNLNETGESLENEGAKARLVYSRPNIVVSRDGRRMKYARRAGGAGKKAGK